MVKAAVKILARSRLRFLPEQAVTTEQISQCDSAEPAARVPEKITTSRLPMHGLDPLGETDNSVSDP
jgi:hypothetical protein